MRSFYKTKILFPLMHLSIGNCETGELRKTLLAQASGAVLEIGFGSGLNLKYYPAAVSEIEAIDPSQAAYPIGVDTPVVHFTAMAAEALDFEDDSFDTVVCTFTLCSVTDVAQVLREVRRVLRPGGKFLFLEHGKSWYPEMSWIQNLANPFYRVLACGCRVNRDVPGELVKSGFQLNSLQKIRAKRQPISGFYYLGMATVDDPERV